jgi:tRNA/tmRNA/rRNA uracil-C5-methylase (TrmA/RlmC/RlmD family)
MDHLAVTLRKAGVNDLLLVFPQPKRDRAHLEAHFKKEGLQQIVDWYTKKVVTAARDRIVTRVREMLQAEESSDDVSSSPRTIRVMVLSEDVG